MQKKKKTKHNILSLFANIGVAEALLGDIGKVVVANEIDPKRAALYQNIYSDSKMICGDITKKEIIEEIIEESKTAKVDIIMATPPCQGMSTAGQMKKEDPRNLLFLYAIRIIKEIKPSYFMFENVPG